MVTLFSSNKFDDEGEDKVRGMFRENTNLMMSWGITNNGGRVENKHLMMKVVNNKYGGMPLQNIPDDEL
jgi:hypothetical protein